MPPGEIIAFMAMGIGALICLLLFGLPLYLSWSYHKRKMEEMRLKSRIQIDEQTKLAIQALREEFNSLRDTTTQYDVSFDSALKRIESRMSHMEQRITTVEQEDRAIQAQRL